MSNEIMRITFCIIREIIYCSLWCYGQSWEIFNKNIRSLLNTLSPWASLCVKITVNSKNILKATIFEFLCRQKMSLYFRLNGFLLFFAIFWSISHIFSFFVNRLNFLKLFFHLWIYMLFHRMWQILNYTPYLHTCWFINVFDIMKICPHKLHFMNLFFTHFNNFSSVTKVVLG